MRADIPRLVAVNTFETTPRMTASGQGKPLRPIMRPAKGASQTEFLW